LFLWNGALFADYTYPTPKVGFKPFMPPSHSTQAV